MIEETYGRIINMSSQARDRASRRDDLLHDKRRSIIDRCSHRVGPYNSTSTRSAPTHRDRRHARGPVEPNSSATLANSTLGLSARRWKSRRRVVSHLAGASDHRRTGWSPGDGPEVTYRRCGATVLRGPRDRSPPQPPKESRPRTARQSRASCARSFGFESSPSCSGRQRSRVGTANQDEGVDALFRRVRFSQHIGSPTDRHPRKHGRRAPSVGGRNVERRRTVTQARSRRYGSSARWPADHPLRSPGKAGPMAFLDCVRGRRVFLGLRSG